MVGMMMCDDVLRINYVVCPFYVRCAYLLYCVTTKPVSMISHTSLLQCVHVRDLYIYHDRHELNTLIVSTYVRIQRGFKFFNQCYFATYLLFIYIIFIFKTKKQIFVYSQTDIHLTLFI